MVTIKRSKHFFSRLAVVLCVTLAFAIGLLYEVPVSKAQGLEDAHLSEIDQIDRAIQEKGARWVAGETSVSRLSLTEKQKLLGSVKPGMISEEEPFISYIPEAALPPSLDWRNNGGNFITPIRNQGGCGSCWAFAATAALESATLIFNNASGVDLDLAEQNLVSCSGAGSCNGGSPSYSASYIQSTGLPLETCYPYTATNGSCGNACANWQSSTYKISGWSWVTYSPATVNALKSAIVNGPIITTFAVYSDFFSYVSGVYSYTSGSLAGYHAVLLVGYDDPGQYFIVKNSWGTWWGESGYFRIAYSEVTGKSEFGEYSVAYGSAVPPNSETISSPSLASGSSSGAAGTSYTYTIGGASSSQGHSVQYLFDWADGTNSDWLPVGQTSASKSWSTSGTYYIKARARCAMHTTTLSGWSSALTVSISSPETVSVPTVLSGTTNGTPGSSYSYTSGGASSNQGHNLQYLFDWGDGTNSGWLMPDMTGASKTWSSSGTYSVRAQARCAVHTSVVSSWSASLAATIQCPAPGTPSSLSPSSSAAGISTSPTLYWTASDASSYDVYFGTSSDPSYAMSTTNTTFSAPGLSYSTTYYWKVVARNNCGNSTSGSVWSFTTTGDSTLSFRILRPNGGEILPVGSSSPVQWQAPPEATKFRLLYSVNGTAWRAIASNVTGTSYDWQAPTLKDSQKNCFVRMIAFNSKGAKIGEGRSEGPFSIQGVNLTSPNQGISLQAGATRTITWETVGSLGSVQDARLYFSNNGGASWRLITTIPGNPGNYDWQVPPTSSSQTKCKVKVVLRDLKKKTLATDINEGYFTIQSSP